MQLKYNEINKNQLISSETPFLENFQDCIKINKKNKISQSTLNCYYNALNIFDEKFGNTAIKNFSQLKYSEMLKEYAEGHIIDQTWNDPIYERKPTKKEEDKFMSLTEYRKLK